VGNQPYFDGRSPSSAVTMKPNTSSTLASAFQGLRLSLAAPIRPRILTQRLASPITTQQDRIRRDVRAFSSSAPAMGTWLEPFIDRTKKKMKGRPRVATGGSVKGTTVVWGDYGLRMRDHHRRISAKQLKLAEDTIKQRLRGERYRLYKRVNCNIGVYTSGNEASVIPLSHCHCKSANRRTDAYG